MGLKEFLVDSNGSHVRSRKPLAVYERKLTREQRKLAHKKSRSKNWEKQRKKTVRVHGKIINIREDFTDQLSAKLVDENQTSSSAKNENCLIDTNCKNKILGKPQK